jgi:hypothetical protein
MNLECLFKKKCWKRCIHLKIVYPQVVQKGEGMFELRWGVGHKLLINFIRRGDHHGLLWPMSQEGKGIDSIRT